MAVTRDERLEVLASSDGTHWTTLTSTSWQLSKDATPAPGTVVVAAVDMAERPDGSAVMVGWVQIDNIEPSHITFLYRVSVVRRDGPSPSGQ